ncbi:MAG: zinc ribbon domain-containing protein [Thermoplasmata archaeon]
MIKNLFSKREHRNMQGVTKEEVMQASARFWRSRNFGVNFTAPYSLHCEQFQSKLGLRQSVDVIAVEEGAGTGVDLSFSAELTDAGAVAGIATAVIVPVVTVAVGAISYVEYENDAQRMMAEFWSHLASLPRGPQPPQGPASAESSRACPHCGAPAEGAGSFCRFCGTRL